MTPDVVTPAQTDLPQTPAVRLVYVDPETKSVVGPLVFNAAGMPISKPYTPAPIAPDVPGKKPDRKERFRFMRKFYPYGTYRSMQRVFKIDGKVKEAEPHRTLDEVLPLALNQAYWSWDEAPRSS